MSNNRKGMVDAGLIFAGIIVLLLVGNQLFSTHQYCTSTSDCPEGEYCYIASGTAGTCETLKSEGEYCTADYQCASGQCDESWNECVGATSCYELGHSCTSGQQCCSNKCDVYTSRCVSEYTTTTVGGVTTTTVKATGCHSSYEIGGKTDWNVGEVTDYDCNYAIYHVCGSDGLLHSCTYGNIYGNCDIKANTLVGIKCGWTVGCGAQGDKCFTSAECCGDLRCVGGVCQVEEVACKGEDWNCNSDNECCPGFSCQAYKLWKTCQPYQVRDGCEDWCEEQYCYMEDLCGRCNVCQNWQPDVTTCYWEGITYQDGEIIDKFCNDGYYILCQNGVKQTISKQANLERFKQVCPEIDCAVQAEDCGLFKGCCSGLVCKNGVCQPEGYECISEGGNCDSSNDKCCTGLKCLPFMVWSTCQSEDKQLCDNKWVDMVAGFTQTSCTIAGILLIGFALLGLFMVFSMIGGR